MNSAIQISKKAVRDSRPGRVFRRWIYSGDTYYCPVCDGHARKFLSFGSYRRSNARCPFCDSLERHRAAWILIERQLNLVSDKLIQMLHFAPANCLEQRLRTMPGLDYITVDLDKNNVQARMDITRLALPDNAFDMVICSHVLEHVVYDVDAMAELFRIMKNDGWALIIVPISAEETIEDSSVTDPNERLALYGQFDHVRRYGPDIHERLESVGFELEKMSEAQVVDTQQSIRFAIGDAPIFVCRKH